MVVDPGLLILVSEFGIYVGTLVIDQLDKHIVKKGKNLNDDVKAAVKELQETHKDIPESRFKITGRYGLESRISTSPITESKSVTSRRAVAFPNQQSIRRRSDAEDIKNIPLLKRDTVRVTS
uniref:Uncharacterized protein n=1 Tax=Mycena chlorophos TaxID=658473 RepID=A0ABQ0M892_MYCCL|nr:predicted protein [Mycena chlorophos]